VRNAVRIRPIWYSAIPLIAWWAGLPIWWALGIQRAASILVAIPLGLWLVMNRKKLELPFPLAVFGAFICWVLLSLIAVTTLRYGLAYGMRLAFYTAAFVIGLYTWNALRRGLNPRLLIWPIVALWGAAVVLSFPGLMHAGLGFPTPVEWMLHKAGIYNPFLSDSSHAQFSEWDQAYGTPRPSPLFAYTNEWGAAMGITTPIAVYAMLTTTHRRARLLVAGLLLLAAVPILSSLNRGCWISLAVAIGYVVIRKTCAGDLRPLVSVAVVSVAVAGIIAASPLSELLTERMDNPNTSTRATLYSASVHLAMESPLVGYGAPQSSEGLADSNDVAIGTHGQIWTLLVSQGFVGAALFVLALICFVWFARPLRGSSPAVWLHAVGLVALVQLAFYEVVPDGLAITFVALAICATTAGRYAPTPAPQSTSDSRLKPSHR